MKWLAAGAVVFFAAAALAYEGRVPPMAISENYLKEATARERERALEQSLAAKDAEIARLREELANADDAKDWAEAQSLGVADAARLSKLPERTQRRLAVAIIRESRKNGLDPLLTVAVIRTESAFDAYAVSKVGALGLMQVMPDTGKYWAGLRGETLARANHLFEVETNIALGTSYLAELIRRFGSVESALCAYNVGPGAAKGVLANRAERKKYMAGYPAKVMGDYRKLKAKLAQAKNGL